MFQSTLTSQPAAPRPVQAKQSRQTPPGPPWPTALWDVRPAGALRRGIDVATGAGRDVVTEQAGA